MPDRICLISTFWFPSYLALLALVLFAPIRTSGLVANSSPLDGLRRHSALPPGQPTTHLGVVMATDAVMQVKTLPSENKGQDWADALDEPRDSFLIPYSLRKLPDRMLIVPRSILSLYPLRC